MSLLPAKIDLDAGSICVSRSWFGVVRKHTAAGVPGSLFCAFHPPGVCSHFTLLLTVSGDSGSETGSCLRAIQQLLHSRLRAFEGAWGGHSTPGCPCSCRSPGPHLLVEIQSDLPGLPGKGLGSEAQPGDRRYSRCLVVFLYFMIQFRGFFSFQIWVVRVNKKKSSVPLPSERTVGVTVMSFLATLG